MIPKTNFSETLSLSLSLSPPIALPRETMTRLSNSTDSRSLPNAGPGQLKGGTNDKQI